jgi:hypothetical protein
MIMLVFAQTATLSQDWRIEAEQAMKPEPPQIYKEFLAAKPTLVERPPIPASEVTEGLRITVLSGGVQFVRDSRNIRLDKDGNMWVDPSPVVYDSVRQEMRATDVALRDRDLGALRALFQELPSKMSEMELDEFNYQTLRRHFLRSGLLIADLENDAQAAVGFLGLIGFRDAGTLPSALLPVYAAKAGLRSEGLVAEIGTVIRPKIASLFEWPMPGPENLVFYAEVLAMQRLSSLPWLQEVHRRRALAEYPEQALP